MTSIECIKKGKDMSDTKTAANFVKNKKLIETLRLSKFTTSIQHPELEYFWYDMKLADQFLGFLKQQDIYISSSGLFIDSSNCLYFMWDVQSYTLQSARSLALQQIAKL